MHPLASKGHQRSVYCLSVNLPTSKGQKSSLRWHAYHSLHAVQQWINHPVWSKPTAWSLNCVGVLHSFSCRHCQWEKLDLCPEWTPLSFEGLWSFSPPAGLHLQLSLAKAAASSNYTPSSTLASTEMAEVGGSKKSRTQFTPQQMLYLEEQYSKCAFPKQGEREKIAKHLSLSQQVVQVCSRMA